MVYKTKEIGKYILWWLAGSIFLCAFSTIQKISIGAPIVLRGYIVPFIFGGVASLFISFWFYRTRIAQRELESANQTLELRVEQRTVKLQQRNKELEAALSEIKTLKGLIPICANCKKIRDDEGYWQQVEKYVSDRTEVQFSHSICPDCAKKLYPKLYKK